MGILPIDKWIYQLDFKRDEVNRKHSEVVQTENTIDSRIKVFNHQLEQYKLLITNNALLIYIEKTIRMQDLELKDFTAQIDALPPPVKGDVVLNAAIAVTELIGGIFVLKFVVNIGKLAKNALWPAEGVGEEVSEEVVEDLAEGAFDAGLVEVADSSATESLESASEEITEEVVESSTSATLASTGIGILLAVGLDVIFGAINGAKEAEELDKILNDLDDKMKIVNGYLTTVDSKSGELTTKSVDQIGTFKKVVAAMKDLLPPDHAPTFDTSFPDSIDSLDKCLAAQQTALTQFSMLSQLRTTYVSALDNHRNPTKAAVVTAVLLSSPAWVTEQILNEIWDNVLSKYSTLMKNAK